MSINEWTNQNLHCIDSSKADSYQAGKKIIFLRNLKFDPRDHKKHAI
jgi:hypothetical protein